MTDSPKPILEALVDVMVDVKHVGKGDRNEFHKFMYRGIDRIMNEVGPALRRHRVIVIPTLLKLDSRDTTTEKGKTAREVTVRVKYTFHGPAGDTLETVVPGESADTGDKAVSKAMSVAYRTAMIQALSIPTDERDPDSQVYTRTEGQLVGWKKRIWEHAESVGWDVDVLAQAYAEWSEGGDIAEADVDQLIAYHNHLVPPKKVKRAPVNEAAS